MSLTSDVLKTRYGSPINHQPIERPIGVGTLTLYRGSVALVSGGTTVTAGYLKNAATPASNDIVIGILDGYGPTCGVADTVPGMGGSVLNTGNGALTANVVTGAFLLAGGTSSDALTITNINKNVYLIDEITVGATDGSGTRPVAGLLVAIPATDASIPTGMVAVNLGTSASPWGGV
jgi:hypothetical protein